MRTLDEFDYVDKRYYLAVYDSWCSAIDGTEGTWEPLISQCLSGTIPSDIRAAPFVYFELAAGLAATNHLEQAWKAINDGEVDGLGVLYMCGLARVPSFDDLRADDFYGAKFEDWFNNRARGFGLHPLKELGEIVQEWRDARRHSANQRS